MANGEKVVVTKTKECMRSNYRVFRQEVSRTERYQTKEVQCRRAEAAWYRPPRLPLRICAPSLPIGGHRHCIKFLGHGDPTTQRN